MNNTPFKIIYFKITYNHVAISSAFLIEEGGLDGHASPVDPYPQCVAVDHIVVWGPPSH